MGIVYNGAGVPTLSGADPFSGGAPTTTLSGGATLTGVATTPTTPAAPYDPTAAALAAGYINPFATPTNTATTTPTTTTPISGGVSTTGGNVTNAPVQNNSATQNNYATQNLSTAINNNYNPFQSGSAIQQPQALQSLQAQSPQALQASQPGTAGGSLQGNATQQQLTTIPGTNTTPTVYQSAGPMQMGQGYQGANSFTGATSDRAGGPDATGGAPQGAQPGAPQDPRDAQIAILQQQLANQGKTLDQAAANRGIDMSAEGIPPVPGPSAPAQTPYLPGTQPAAPGQPAQPGQPGQAPAQPQQKGLIPQWLRNASRNYLVNNNAYAAANYQHQMAAEAARQAAVAHGQWEMYKQHDQQQATSNLKDKEIKAKMDEEALKAKTVKALTDAQKLTSIGEFYKLPPNSPERAEIAKVNPDLIQHMNDPMNEVAAAGMMKAGADAQQAVVDDMLAKGTFFDNLSLSLQKVKNGQMTNEMLFKTMDDQVAKIKADAQKATSTNQVQQATAPAQVASANANAMSDVTKALNEPTNQSLSQAGHRAGIASVAGNTAMNLKLMQPTPTTKEGRAAQDAQQQALAGGAIYNANAASAQAAGGPLQVPPPPAGMPAFAPSPQNTGAFGPQIQGQGQQFQAPPAPGAVPPPPPGSASAMGPNGMPQPLQGSAQASMQMFNPYAQQAPPQQPQVQQASAQQTAQPQVAAQQPQQPAPPKDQIRNGPDGFQYRVIPDAMLPKDPTQRTALLVSQFGLDLGANLVTHSPGLIANAVTGAVGKLYGALTAAAQAGDAAVTKNLEKDFQKTVKQVAGNELVQPEARGLKKGAMLSDPELISQFGLSAAGNPHAFNMLVSQAGWGGVSNVRHDQPLLPMVSMQDEWKRDQETLKRVLPNSLEAAAIKAKYDMNEAPAVNRANPSMSAMGRGALDALRSF